MEAWRIKVLIPAFQLHCFYVVLFVPVAINKRDNDAQSTAVDMEKAGSKNIRLASGLEQALAVGSGGLLSSPSVAILERERERERGV